MGKGRGGDISGTSGKTERKGGKRGWLYVSKPITSEQCLTKSCA